MLTTQNLIKPPIKTQHFQNKRNRANLTYPEKTGLIAKFFMAILIITVLEGAFRKWVSSDLTYPLVALRDLLAACGIFLATKTNALKHSRRLTLLLLLLSVMLVIWGLVQTLINNNDPRIFAYGLRFWLLYLWFSVLAAINMSTHDFKQITRLLLWLLILMCPLAVMQHFLPVNSIWNTQLADGGNIFTVVRGIVRTTGTFTFTNGYTAFLAMCAPFALAGLGKKSIWENNKMALICLFALLASTIVSGSRFSVIFLTVLILIYTTNNIWYSKGKHKLTALTITFLIFASLPILFLIFDRAVDATLTRFETAAANEPFFGRLAYSFLPRGEFSFFGAGLGMGTNIAGVIAGGGSRFLLAESENARTILELGILGWFILVFKVLAVTYSLLVSMKLARRTGNILSLLLWATTGLALLSWSISAQLTINALGNLLLGLAIAALRLQKAGHLQ